MRIKDIMSILEEVAPPHFQESYDNSGLIVGHPEDEVSGVLFCLDSTEDIILEAVQKGCNLVVAHHPIVFRGLKRLNGFSYVERTVMTAIRKGVAIYAIHTNLDNVYASGVNSRIASRLDLMNTRILNPKSGLDAVGAGIIGQLPQPMDAQRFLHVLKARMSVSVVRHTALINRPLRTVAVCGGAGSFLLGIAKEASADAFVTADFKYHEFFDAEGALLIADIGHFESEQFTIQLLFDIVSEKKPNFALHCTELNTNPVHYFV
jgi:dinuclear metal center YbgI/SA1388 family protein